MNTNNALNTINPTISTNVSSKNTDRPLNRTLNWVVNGVIVATVALLTQNYLKTSSSQSSESSSDLQMNWGYAYLFTLFSLIAIKLGMWYTQQPDNKTKNDNTTDFKNQPTVLDNPDYSVKEGVEIVEKVIPFTLTKRKDRSITMALSQPKTYIRKDQTTTEEEQASLLTTRHQTDPKKIRVYNIGYEIIEDLKNLFDKEGSRTHFTKSYKGTSLRTTLEKAYINFIDKKSEIKNYLDGSSDNIPNKQEITENFKDSLQNDPNFKEYLKNFIKATSVDLVACDFLVKEMEHHLGLKLQDKVKSYMPAEF